ncbi:MAG: biotin/lipoyl-binding protein [Proteobacteria bacterium]|nr:biotin/lipoyl-binding protein [Pseudomonadota bacterium]
MFRRLLVANRGEIACRVMRTARRLGVESVAVFSDADADALHVRSADLAHRIGPAESERSYLSVERILEAARASGAEALHPGYGFLAENAELAEACAGQGVVFVGPPPEAIRVMGLKHEARRRMDQAGVPVLPGATEDEGELSRAAGALGYPVMLKPVAGGGGKGMQRVDGPEQFEAALERARREARAAFGDSRMLLERCLDRPRHVEVQVFADAHGSAVHLFERDCSLQRRHQKVIEEAPAPGLSEELRARLGEAAVAAARAVGYVGAGTVEFLFDPEAGEPGFFFLEMNTRLQVEHPVTEFITGEDLVEWQLRVAAGEPLPKSQAELARRGHAVEARLYAEDPARDYRPSTGRLLRFRAPESLRVDAGVEQGDTVSPHYDPLLAKLVAWGPDRDSAVRFLADGLRRTEVAGVVTNLGLLHRVCASDAFAEARVDTGFLERHRCELIPEPADGADDALLFALLRLRVDRAAAVANDPADPHSPWGATDGFRLNAPARERLELTRGERRFEVEVRVERDGLAVEAAGRAWRVRGEPRAEGDWIEAEVDGERRRVCALSDGPEFWVLAPGEQHRIAYHDPRNADRRHEAPRGAVAAPLPGRVSKLLVAPGDRVRSGQTLAIVEAMKMEHGVAAPRDGIVGEIHFRAGDQVEEGDELLSLSDPEDEPRN